MRAVQRRGVVVRPAALLPFSCAYDVLAEPGVATGTGLERVGSGSQHRIAVMRASGLSDRIGATVEIERHLCESPFA